jgi:hypothetical protein
MFERFRSQAEANNPFSMRNMQPMFNEAYQRTSRAWGNEMAGTPGFLARGSVTPGSISRLRARNTRAGTESIANAQAGVASENARAKRDYLIQKQLIKDQKKAQGGGGVGGAIGKIAGGAAGYALSGGNPLGAVKSFLGTRKLPSLETMNRPDYGWLGGGS